jgi:hypothetical protein
MPGCRLVADLGGIGRAVSVVGPVLRAEELREQVRLGRDEPPVADVVACCGVFTRIRTLELRAIADRTSSWSHFRRNWLTALSLSSAWTPAVLILSSTAT